MARTDEPDTFALTEEQANRLGHLARLSRRQPTALRFIYESIKDSNYVVPKGHVGVFIDWPGDHTAYVLLRPDGRIA